MTHLSVFNRIIQFTVAWRTHLTCLYLLLHTGASLVGQAPLKTVAPEKSISGMVVDEQQNPLPAVNIILVGTRQGTVTDAQGSFSIQVNSEDAVLEFRSVGYLTKQIAVGNSSQLNITLLPDTQTLSEVMITALGVQRQQRTIGYALSEVAGKTMAQSMTVNPVEALQGRVAGVNVSNTANGTFGSSRITVRGNSTFDTNTQPIFVVDGIILDNETNVSGPDWGNQLKNLSPEDFEKVTVLKGAAATALYGSRAIHGVVMITTKSGANRKGLGVSFNQTLGTRYVYDGPDFQNQYGYGPSAGMFSNDVTNGRPDKDKYDNQQFAFYELIDGQYIPSLQHNNSEENAASWGPRLEGQEYIDYDGSRAQWLPQPDNYRDMFDKGFLNSTNVAVDGGNDQTNFRLSYTNFTEKGVIPKNEFRRNAFALNGSQQLVKDVASIRAGIMYARSKSENPPSGALMGAWFHDGFPRSYDPSKWRNNYKDADGGVPYPTNTAKYMYTRKSMTWFNIYERDQQRDEGSLLINAELDLNLGKGFSALLAGNINQFTYKQEDKVAATSQDRLSNARYALGHGEKFQSNLFAHLMYQRDLNDNLSFDMLLGGASWNTDASFSSSSTSGGFKVPDFYSLSNSLNAPLVNSGIGERKTINSVYAYANFAYKSAWYLSVTGRNDWSSALVYPDGSGNNAYFYPSISLGWVANETFSLPNIISIAKLRVSYAKVGNDTDAFLLSHGFVSPSFSEEPNLSLYKLKSTTAVSRNLKPERKQSFETGFDLRLWQGRARIDFAFYKDNTKGQIIQLAVPNESGIANQLINAGNLQNQGVELMVSGVPIQTELLTWDIGINLTHNKDKIISLYPGVAEKLLYGNPDDAGAGTATYAYVGGAYGEISTRQGYKFYQATDDNGNPVEHRNNGLPVFSQRNNWSVTYLNGRQNKDSLVRMGNMQPDWYGSLFTGLEFKSFRLSAMIDASYGGDLYSGTYRYGLHQGVIASSLPYRDESQGGIVWTSQGFGNNQYGKTYQDGYIPFGVFPDNTTVRFRNDQGVETTYDVSGMTYQEAYEQGMVEPTHWSGHIYRWTSASTGTPLMAVFESNWVMLRELILTYQLPVSFMEKLSLTNASISLIGRNLGFLHNSMPDNINPIIGNNAAGNALQQGFAPYTRTISLSLNATF